MNILQHIKVPRESWNMDRPAYQYNAPSNQWDRLANNDLNREQTEAELEQDIWIRYGLTVQELRELDDKTFNDLITAILNAREEKTRAYLDELKHGFYQPPADEHAPPEPSKELKKVPRLEELTQTQFNQKHKPLTAENGRLFIDSEWKEYFRGLRTTEDDPREYRRRTGKPHLCNSMSA